ncbi:MAG: hypothetical protein AAFX90_05555 [Pseudomonadota bacterium]
MIKLFLTVGFVCCAAFKVSASPEDDAKYIASQFLLEEQILTMRKNASRYYVEYLDGLLSKYTVRVKDTKRLENLVPEEITDIAINGHLDEVTQWHLETYDEQQLSEIRAFYLTGAWQKLKKLSHKECKAGWVEKTVIAPQLRGYEEARIQRHLSPSEFQNYLDFFGSETGKAFGKLREYEVTCSEQYTSTSVFELRQGEETLRTEFVLSALKAKGLFQFSNPVARKDFIAKIESEIP